MDQGGNGGAALNTCADTTGGCHALPLGVSTNSPAVGGFEAPTMRGMTDRFLHFSGGFTNAQEVLDAVAGQSQLGVIPWNPAQGLDERVVFSAGFVAFQPAYNVFPDDMFQMFEEASVGHSGALGRQVSLNTLTTNGAHLAATDQLLAALEGADSRGGVNLRGEGLRAGAPVTLSFNFGDWKIGGGSVSLSHAALIAEAQSGTLVATVTAHLRQNVGSGFFRQPQLFTFNTGNGPTGDPPLPVIPASPANPAAFTVGVIDAMNGPKVLIDGQAVSATVTCVGGPFNPYCTAAEGERLSIDLAALPAAGTRLLQIQNVEGALSTEMPICVGSVAGCLQP
jgi:hypothetical protein